jgi:hypothetical protein
MLKWTEDIGLDSSLGNVPGLVHTGVLASIPGLTTTFLLPCFLMLTSGLLSLIDTGISQAISGLGNLTVTKKGGGGSFEINKERGLLWDRGDRPGWLSN